MVNLELYKVFYTVAKCGSLTKAAQELFISQPAVSQAIKQLETQMGTSLFNRTHKGMDLSAGGGKLIYKQVEEALTLLEDAENKLMELKTVASGVIRIGATDSIFSNVIADKIAEFHQRYPAVKLELISSTSPYTISQLKEGKCDVAFINLPASDDEVRFYGTVALLSDIFVAGKEFADRAAEIIPLEDLQEFPLMMIEENTIARRAFASFCETLGVRLSPDIEVANWDLMKKLVIKGMGVGCIPREYCREELSNGELYEIKTQPALPVRGVGVALAKHTTLSYAIKEFLAMFSQD
ncbi:MAG: LysR family transcriptional regulator [Clostridia bacterium]|jgi:DNA-binding transcriptional LysR family regulator|nr:LysR family transcriptional regulator [Clostridia bacterium]